MLGSIHYDAGHPANGEEIIFTSSEETARDDHTPIYTESSAVNLTSASPRMRLTSEVDSMYYG